MTAPHVLVANVFFAPYSFGGATIVAEQVVHQLKAQTDWQISAVSVISRSDLVPYTVIKTEKDGVPNYLINVPHGRSYTEVYDNPRINECLARLVDSLAPDLVHAHCLQDLGTGLLTIAQSRDIPTVLSVHDFWWICERQFMITPNQVYCAQSPVQVEQCRSCVEDISNARTRMAHLRRLAAGVNLITYPSKFALDLCESSGLSGQASTVWQNGVRLPAEDFRDKQARRRAADPRTVFGFVGGPSQIKGWPLLRRAFVDIDRDDFRGVLVDGSLEGNWWTDEDLEKLQGDWSIQPRFTQSQMDDFYARIDVLLFMSQWKETFGLAIREAVSRGIRVIQTNSGGTVEHGAADPAGMLEIGDGSDKLIALLNEALDSGPGETKPQPVTSFAEQAAQFVELSAPLLR